MEECMSPAEVKGKKKKESSGILKEMKQKFRPMKPTTQDGEVSQSEGMEDQREEPANQQDNLSTHSELSASNDSLSDNNNTKEKGGILSGRFRLAPKPAEHSLPAQENESVHSKLSASNDSLSDIDKKEKGGMFTGKFRKTPKPSGGPTPAQDNLSTHSELSASNDSLSDNNTKINREVTQSECREDQSEPEHRQDKGVFGGIFWKIPKERAATFTSYITDTKPEGERNITDIKKISSVSSTDSHSVELPQIHTSTDTCLEPPENKQEKGGKFTGLFRKSPKPAEDTASVQEIASIHGELSASNDSLSDIDTKKKGGKFTGLFRKSPKPAEDTAPVQEIASIHGELSASNDSLSDIDTKKKGAKFTGLFRKSPKPAEDTAPVQEIESIHGELSASNDSLSDIDTKKKGGKFTGLFRKSPKPAEDTAPVQEIASIHGELSASNDSLSDIDKKEKGGKFPGLFRKSSKPAEDTAPVQEIASIHGELSASNDSLSDIDTKKKGGKFTGLFRKSPKPAEDTAPVQDSSETESGTPAGAEKRKDSFRRKRRVSFRVRRTLPRNPNVLFRSATEDSDEQENLVESVEMEELPSVQESSVEIQMVEMAPLSSEGNLLDSEEVDDGLLEWWRTVEGWDEWNESSNFKEDEEELAVEQVADRVYLAAQLFVRLFNQRGASLQQRILELLTVADAADNFHKRTLATSMGGRVASVVGSVTTITGLILAPFTFGSSIIVTAVGIGVATAGTITSASAHITDSVHSNFGRKKVEKMIEGYQEEVKDIRECMDFVQEGMDALQEWNFEKYTESVAKRALNRNIKHVVKEGARAGKALMINTDKLVSTVQVLSVAGGAAKAAQAISVTTGVMSALFLALDIFFLAKDSHDFRKGAKTKFAAKLREVCKELQDGLLLLNRVKTELQKTMDGIEVEEFEEEEEEEEKSDLECDPEELALLEEEINQIEQKLDQQVQEKKRREEEEEKKNDSEEHHLKPPEDEKIGKSKKEGEGQKEEQRLVKESLLGVERGAGKHGTDKKLKEKIQDQDETKQKTKENQQDIQEEKKRAVDEKGISGKVEENEHWKSGEKQEDGHREKDQRTWTEQGESGKREKEQWKSPKRVEDDQKQKEQYNNDDQWKSTKKVVYGKQRKKTREWDERGRSGKSNRDEHEHSHKMEGDEQGKSRERGSNESGKREKNAVLSSLPPPARPRSKAFSNVPEEARCEGPVTEPKAPPPVPHRKRASHREPLSI